MDFILAEVLLGNPLRSDLSRAVLVAAARMVAATWSQITRAVAEISVFGSQFIGRLVNSLERD